MIVENINHVSCVEILICLIELQNCDFLSWLFMSLMLQLVVAKITYFFFQGN